MEPLENVAEVAAWALGVDEPLPQPSIHVRGDRHRELGSSHADSDSTRMQVTAAEMEEADAA
jgi:hypothetical protein